LLVKNFDKGKQKTPSNATFFNFVRLIGTNFEDFVGCKHDISSRFIRINKGKTNFNTFNR